MKSARRHLYYESKCGRLLGLVFVELVDLLRELGDRVVVLLAQVGHGLLMLQVGLLEVAPELGEFGFATLVQLHLGRRGTAGLLQTLAQLLDLTSKVGALLLSLFRKTNKKVNAMSGITYSPASLLANMPY